MGGDSGYSRPGIAGSGTIACGVAATVSQVSHVRLLARSDASAWRAEEAAQTEARKLDGGSPDRIKVTTDASDLADCDLIVEAIVEDADVKVELLTGLGEASSDADVASTTSALPLDDLRDRSGLGHRFFGLHFFNPVTKMELVEVCLPPDVHEGLRGRVEAWCGALGKTAIQVPDQSGFVVNRLLFPLLFDAVRLVEATGMSAADVDACMRLGAGHPMGPLALLDFVGLDVAAAIGASLHADSGRESDLVPERIHELIAAGKLGRKSGAGFYDY
ncbi:MAG: 3-hydroxyacyl-CoA dehydrogenase family protein [Solirubrobacterales bacterium]